MSILSKLKTRIKKDELLGQWNTDDSSGFMIVMGSWVEFRKDGSGSYESWSNGDGETSYNYKGNFNWKRLEKNRITIQEINSEKMELIEYQIRKVNGRKELSSKQKQSGTDVIEGFWNFFQVMFKILITCYNNV